MSDTPANVGRYVIFGRCIQRYYAGAPGDGDKSGSWIEKPDNARRFVFTDHAENCIEDEDLGECSVRSIPIEDSYANQDH